MANINLPAPNTKGAMSVEEAIRQRRSRRNFSDTPLALAEAAQVLWAAQGLTEGRKRTVPSAGAAFPLELYVAVGMGTVEGLEAGVYHYLPSGHALERHAEGDIRPMIARASLGQGFLAQAPLDLLMAADLSRTAQRYGDRARRYVDMEAGHASQNVHLQAEALGLGTVAVGAFHDDDVAAAFRLPASLRPLYLMPVGHAT